MGTYVDKIADPPFEWGESAWPGTGSDLTKDLVEAKVNASMSTAENMLTKLVGVDGNSGYLGNLNAIITAYSVPVIPDFTVTIPDISTTPDSRPVPDLSGLDTTFPVFSTPVPSLTTLPTVDLSSLTPAEMPEEITAAIAWIESAHDTTLFADLLTRIRNDLQSGATGVGAVIEQEIFDRALARQNIEEDKAQAEIEDYFASRGFDLPPLAMAARLAEHTNSRLLRTADLNGKILIEQADLAQKNSQFVISAAKDLEAVLRDFTSKQNDRSLDYAKAVAANAIAIYVAAVQAYVAVAEANKMYVEVQVENLKAIVEYNKGLISSFAAEAEAYGVIVEAQSKANDAVIGIFEADVKGYDAETRAQSAAQQIIIEEYKLKLQNGDIQLRKAIAEIEAELQAFGTESSLREKIAEAMANIAMQSVASAYGSVNASVGLSHQTGRSEADHYTHSEGRTIGYDITNTLHESHPFEEEIPAVP